MSAHTLAKRLVARISGQVHANHDAMDAGLAPENYYKLVGRNQQLTEFKRWVSEELAEVHKDDD